MGVLGRIWRGKGNEKRQIRKKCWGEGWRLSDQWLIGEQRRIAAIREKREKKEEKARFEKMAEKMHAKRVERVRRREKRNKLLKS